MNLRKFIFAWFCIVLSAVLISSCSEAQSEGPSETEVEVMILGTLHLTGGGSDVVNPKVKDYLAPKGQEEIRQLLDKLETYAPDKIMLELEPQYEDKFNQSYRAYLEGGHQLGVSEREQIGMRLANRLGHERLYAVDFDSFLDHRGAQAAAEELGQEHLIKEYQGWIDQFIARDNVQENLPLIERLILMNSDERWLQRKAFLTVAQMGSPEDPQGALQVMIWWERNMVIFARTAQYAEPGDKILIVIGAGHRDILQDFFGDAHGFELVSPVPYLEK